MKITDGEKLILLMLSELYDAVEIDGEIDADFVRSAIFYDHTWSIPWKYPGIPFEGQETPDVVKEVLDISAYTKIHQHLRKDLKNRALVEPLLQFPNDLVKEITEENERLSKENVVELKDVKQQKALDEAKQEDEDLDRLMPDVMDHFNPMAEAEIALLDEEIASAREAKAKVGSKEEQPKPSPQPPALNMELSEQPAEVKDEAKERRAIIFQKEEPVEYVKPKGFWNWIKGY